MKRRGFLSALGIGAVAAPALARAAAAVGTPDPTSAVISQSKLAPAAEIASQLAAGAMTAVATTGYLRAEGIRADDVLVGREECLYFDGNGQPL